MKLYVWGQVRTLQGYHNGEVIAHANSLEEAIDFTCDQTGGDLGKALREELIATKPCVYGETEPYTWIGWGSA